VPTDPRVAYEEVASVLNFYAQAMCGRAVRADVTDALPTCDAVQISDDEIRVRVPESVGVFPTRAENARWMRCLISHEVGHAEFGTDRFCFDRPSRHFRDWRPRLAGARPGLVRGSTVLQLFSRLRDPALARAVFFELEELRIGAALGRPYPGAAADLRWFDERRDVVVRGPDVRWLRLLDRATMAADPTVARLQRVRRPLAREDATVEDTVEAALRVYAVVRRRGATVAAKVEEELHDRDPPEIGRDGDDRRRSGSPELQSVGIAEEDAEGEEEVEGTPGDLPIAPGQHTAARGRPIAYPEWDFRAGGYLPAHCTVWEYSGSPGSTSPYQVALRQYAGLLRAMRSHLEAIHAAAVHDRVRDTDGDSFDLDALVDYMVSRRANGDAASEEVYSRRGALRRDVAAAILLDVSATTGEPVLHRSGGVGNTDPERIHHTILSVSQAASILMMKTAYDLGDRVAFYAFSGLGRHGVEVAVVKEFGTALDHRVARRVGGLRPRRATRMGAALRHVTARLMEQPANRRLLFFVNDGRPFDTDYGRGDTDQPYAVADTRKALDEAAAAGIQAICLTVQESDPTYLPDMCGGTPYELIQYAEELPERLLAAYARLRRQR
jgi:hypothetical protein